MAKTRRLKARRLLDFPAVPPETQYVQGLVKGLPYLEKRRSRAIEQQRYEDEQRRLREEMEYKYAQLNQTQKQATDKAFTELLPKLSEENQRKALDSLSPERRESMGYGWYKPKIQAPTTPMIPAPPRAFPQDPGWRLEKRPDGTYYDPKTGQTVRQRLSPRTKRILQRRGVESAQAPPPAAETQAAMPAPAEETEPIFKPTTKGTTPWEYRPENKDHPAAIAKREANRRKAKDVLGKLTPTQKRKKAELEADKKELEAEFSRLVPIVGNPMLDLEYRTSQVEKADKRIQARLRGYLKAKKAVTKQTIAERQAEDKALADNAMLHIEHLQGSETFTASTPLQEIQGNRDEAMAGWPAYRDRWAIYNVSEERAWRQFTRAYKAIVGPLYGSKAPLPLTPPPDPGEPVTPQTAASEESNAAMSDGDKVFENRCREFYRKLPTTERAKAKANVQLLLEDGMPKIEILNLLE